MKEIKNMTDEDLELELDKAFAALNAAVRQKREIIERLTADMPEFTEVCYKIEDAEGQIFMLSMEKRSRLPNPPSLFGFLDQGDKGDA